MTFPAYRHLLTLGPAPRHLAEPGQRIGQPLGVAARDGVTIVALALAETPTRPEDGPPELLSVYVRPADRGRGIATALVEAIENDLAASGFAEVEAVYMTGKPSLAAVERIFAKRGWAQPVLRTLAVRCTLAEALATPWYGRVRLPRDAEIFSWTELTPGERDDLRESNERAPWIPVALQPWRHDAMGFEPVSSVGLRYRGEVVGWLINHQIEPGTVRFTCGFVRRDVSRRARALPLFSASIRSLSEAGFERCTFTTPAVFPEMFEFTRRHIAPYASFVAETRGTRKTLGHQPRASPKCWTAGPAG
jgi:GNAT superfamily N-acetyltransferase